MSVGVENSKRIARGSEENNMSFRDNPVIKKILKRDRPARIHSGGGGGDGLNMRCWTELNATPSIQALINKRIYYVNNTGEKKDHPSATAVVVTISILHSLLQYKNAIQR